MPAWPVVNTSRSAKDVIDALPPWFTVSAVPPVRRVPEVPRSTAPLKVTLDTAVGPLTLMPVLAPVAVTGPLKVAVPPVRAVTSTARPAFVLLMDPP